MKAELRKVMSFGPLVVEPADWQMLVRHVKALMGENEHSILNALVGKAELSFVVVRCDEYGRSTNRILILPFRNRLDQKLMLTLTELLNVEAFGIVKSDAATTEPNRNDLALSVEIDAKLGKSVYYVIMNPKFEYGVYRNRPEDIHRLMRPAEVEDGAA